MKAAVALLLSIGMLGCFPNNPRHRTYAKYAEGTALVAGIAISAIANTGADCDERMMPGPNVEDSCRTTAKWLSTAGVTLILGGLLGFVATVSTAEDAELQKAAEVQEAKRQEQKANESKQVKLPPGVAPQAPADPQPAADENAPTGQPSGSASSSPSAPQR